MEFHKKSYEIPVKWSKKLEFHKKSYEIPKNGVKNRNSIKKSYEIPNHEKKKIGILRKLEFVSKNLCFQQQQVTTLTLTLP